MHTNSQPLEVDVRRDELALFARIADDLQSKGYSLQHQALPDDLALALFQYQNQLSDTQFDPAGIGRGHGFMQNTFVRSDEICWITGQDDICRRWLDWADSLKTYLNRTLFMGLFSFESHFAHYGPGDFYKRHSDAFQGESNRVLSLVAYLNPNWQPTDGGQLVLYKDTQDTTGIHLQPVLGNLAVFLSEAFPHEVLPATRDRYSIAGWFRVNTSTTDRVDPPR